MSPGSVERWRVVGAAQILGSGRPGPRLGNQSTPGGGSAHAAQSCHAGRLRRKPSTASSAPGGMRNEGLEGFVGVRVEEHRLGRVDARMADQQEA